MTDTLPRDWRRTLLGEVCRVVSGSTPKTDVAEHWGGDIPWLTPDDLSRHTSKHVSGGRRSLTQAGYDSCSTRLVPEGSVLYSSRAPIGYVAVATRPMCTNQGFKTAVPGPDLTSDFLYWQLLALTDDIRVRASGTTFKEISGKAFAATSVVVPPLDEQHRIVAVLENHLSQLDAGGGYLAASRRRAQAVRAGLLAEMWGSAQRVAQTRTVADAGHVITGSTPSTRNGDVFGPGLPFVTPGDLSAGNPVRTSARSLSAAGEASARALPPNSVLAVCIGATLGKSGWTERPVATNQQINALVLDEDRAMAAFVARLMASPQFQSEMRSRASTTTMPLLNKTAFSQLPLPIPPVGAQLSALSKFEAAEAGLVRMNEAVTAAAGRAAALRKALLAAAFAGQL